jgi:outer membrane protein
VEVLLSLRNTFSARRDYAQARYDYLLDTLRLKQAAGSLTVADLQAVNRLLQ